MVTLFSSERMQEIRNGKIISKFVFSFPPTSEDRPPGPVEGLDARGLPNAIVLSWFRPDRGRTQVTKYTVHWGEIHDDENQRDLDGSRLEFTIRGLSECWP